MSGQIQIDPPPRAGTGLHRWCWYAANAARGYGYTPREAAAFILQGMVEAGRPARDAERETRDAVNKAFGFARRWTNAFMTPTPTPPKADAALMSETVRNGFGLVDLWEASPVCFDSPQAAEIYRALMGPDLETLVCIAKAHPANAQTIHLEDALPLVSSSALTCQSPMRAKTGARQMDGAQSPRTSDNCGPRRWAVIEFDPTEDKPEWTQFENPVDAMAALLWKLHELTKALAVVTHSGGKSLHGWFHVEGKSVTEIQTLYAVAQKFGADPPTKSPAQMVRIPDGRRDDGNTQTCFYFNPNLASHGPR